MTSDWLTDAAWEKLVAEQDVWDEAQPCGCQSPDYRGHWECLRHMTGVVEVMGGAWEKRDQAVALAQLMGMPEWQDWNGGEK